MDDPRIDKQPVWVQELLREHGQRIIALEKELAALKRMQAGQHPDSNTFVESGNDEVPVGQSPMVAFRTADGGSFDVKLLKDGSLQVFTSRAVLVAPHNEIDIRLRMTPKEGR
ncbi:DUF7239 family protein [Streptomyces luteogriseus]|uniref:DUF7239 family protein n=1 Tax=Streptomyces luteogriseus TaxID=68233 RepID=UPI00379FF9C0